MLGEIGPPPTPKHHAEEQWWAALCSELWVTWRVSKPHLDAGCLSEKGREELNKEADLRDFSKGMAAW